MVRIRSRTICFTSTYPVVVTSPATTTRPVVSSVSTATRLFGSCRSISSRTESLIWSAILSGCPSVTDSEVKSRPVTVVRPRHALLAGCWSGVTITGGPQRASARLPPGRDRVPDHVRERRLRPSGYAGRAAVAVQEDRFVLGAAEDLAAAHVVDHEQVAPLAGQ